MSSSLIIEHLANLSNRAKELMDGSSKVLIFGDSTDFFVYSSIFFLDSNPKLGFVCEQPCPQQSRYVLSSLFLFGPDLIS